MVSKENYVKYIENFSIDCFENSEFKECRADPANNKYIYDAEGEFKNLCEPREMNIRSKVPHLDGYGEIVKTI